jgi:hypothetical protein
MVKVALVEAAGRQAEGPILEWRSVAEKDKCTIEELAISGDGFEILDRKFSAALTRIVLKANGARSWDARSPDTRPPKINTTGSSTVDRCIG